MSLSPCSIAPPSSPGRGKEQRREDAGRQAFEADRLVESRLGILAGEGARDDVREQAHPSDEVLRPGALPPQAAEAEEAHQLAAHDERLRHVGPDPEALIGEPREAARGRQLVEARIHERLAGAAQRDQVQELFSGPGDAADGRQSVDRPGMGGLQLAGIRIEPRQRAAVDVEGLDDALQPALDDGVDPLGGKVDEGRGQLRDEPLELQKLVRGTRVGPELQRALVPRASDVATPAGAIGPEAAGLRM